MSLSSEKDNRITSIFNQRDAYMPSAVFAVERCLSVRLAGCQTPVLCLND